MPAESRSVSRLGRLVAGGQIDASLAALAWLLLERGIPVLVAGRDAAARDDLLAALLDAMPEGRRPHPGHVAPGTVVVVGSVLAADPEGGGARMGGLRAALAATTARSGLVARVDADDLAGVIDVLERQGLTGDEISFLGVVLVVNETRVDAAHYLRPVARDAGGHVRRLPPAVLAARNAGTGIAEDFSWGVAVDLAERTGTRPHDLEAERDRRAALLAAAVEGSGTTLHAPEPPAA